MCAFCQSLKNGRVSVGAIQKTPEIARKYDEE
jgi:hypothetical protein